MTIHVRTEKGEIRVIPGFHVSKAVKKKIEQSLKMLVADVKPVEELLNKIKKRHPDVGTPRGSLISYMTGQSWSQKRLGKATGIPQGNISQMISGKRPIGPTVAKKLGEVLGVDYRKFL